LVINNPAENKIRYIYFHTASNVHLFSDLYSIYKAKRLKILKSKNQTFSAVCHHQGCMFLVLTDFFLFVAVVRREKIAVTLVLQLCIKKIKVQPFK